MDDRHPKRRKDKYNPYTLSVKEGEYYISFEDGRGMSYCMEIAEELYVLMDSFELEDLSVMNEKERHIIQAEFSDETIGQDKLLQMDTVYDIVWDKICKEQLYQAIDKLPKVQRRRVMLYYFYGLTYEKIAEIEGCTVHSVFVALERAKEKIKKFLK